MKHAIAILCLFSCWLTIAVFAQGQDLSQYDLSTDEGVNAAREAIAGKKIDERSKRCIDRDQSLPGMVIVGGFAFDYGCRFQGVFIGSRYVATEDKALSRSALESLGWKTANRELREKLAQAWLEKGLFAFVTVIRAKNEDFQNHSFQPPGAVTSENGETVVTLWIRLPAGRVRGRPYQLREYRFSSDGDFAGNKTLENFNPVTNGDGKAASTPANVAQRNAVELQDRPREISILFEVPQQIAPQTLMLDETSFGLSQVRN